MIDPAHLASVGEYWGNNCVKNFNCELYIVSEMVAHFLPEFVQSFKGNLLYFLFSVREGPISPITRTVKYCGFWGVRATKGYRVLQGVTRGYRGLQEVTGGYKRLEAVTGGYSGLQEGTRGYMGLQGVTKGYRGLQGVRTG